MTNEPLTPDERRVLDALLEMSREMVRLRAELKARPPGTGLLLRPPSAGALPCKARTIGKERP